MHKPIDLFKTSRYNVVYACARGAELHDSRAGGKAIFCEGVAGIIGDLLQ